MNNKLNVKDLITVGIFSVIYIIVMFAFGMIGYIPIMMLTLPVIIAIVCGIPFMLFLTRVEKFGMVSLMGLVLGIIMFLSGHTWIPIIVFTIMGVISDYILKIGDYSSIKNSIIGYGVFSLGVLGNMLPFFIMRDYYLNMISSSLGTNYVNVLLPYLQNSMMIVLIIFTFVFGLIGGYIGKVILKKHFEKAGIV